MKRTSSDFLSQKEQDLELLLGASACAIDTVTTTIQTLISLNDNISSTIEDISAYQKRLEERKASMVDCREKNARIAENFRRLVEA